MKVPWRAGEEEIQGDEHAAVESMPAWDRYLLYVEAAKTRREIPMEFEEWKAVHDVDRSDVA